MRAPLRPLSLLVGTLLLASLAEGHADAQKIMWSGEEEPEERGRTPDGGPSPGEVTDAVEGGSVGYELAISGATYTERGSAVRLSGIAYVVEGLMELRATAGLEVTLSLHALTPAGDSYRLIAERTVRAREGGRFEVEVPVPDFEMAGPQLLVRVRRAGQPGRTFALPFSTTQSHALSALTDRDRYEPGETVHVWTILRALRGGRPTPGRPILVTLIDPNGRELSRTETTTRASGAVSVDVALPETAAPGRYGVQIASDETIPPVMRPIEVFERTVERLAVAIELEERLVAPGAPLRGTVRVTTPSGTPVRGASVELYATGDFETPVALVTGTDGTARIDTPTPAYLSGDVLSVSCAVRVSHPAYGAASAAASYLLARTAYLVAATPEAGGLVPELDSELFLSVADPLGAPIAAGVELEVRGLGVSGGRASVRTDAHGLAAVTVRLPRGAAALMDCGAAGWVPGTTLEVEVQTSPPISATVCAPVALEAEVLVRPLQAVAGPGDRVEVALFRRPGASGRAVLVEAVFEGRALAFAWADASASRTSLTLPRDVLGVLELRARALAPEGARGALDEEGETLLGTGSRAAILVRPADAFSLALRPDASLHRVRETARIELSASAAPAGGGWATLVARDEAQHAGESDWAMEVVAAELRGAGTGPVAAGDQLLLRAAMAAASSPDGVVVGAPPIVTDPWDEVSWNSGVEGLLRDPIAGREALIRGSLGDWMMQLEALLGEAAGWDPEARARVVRGGVRPDFTPEALQVLEELGGGGTALTLGGLPVRPAMLHDADPSFSFDSAARRIARSRLVFLLLALARLGNPDDPDAARASAGQPPERWLSLLVSLGLVTQEQLNDPWGRPYALRQVTGRLPAVVFSERALDLELSSPGPDGVAGNADDVRDPFARVVPSGTPYAVASGEDALMASLSRIAPGTQVLVGMAQAYGRLGLAAEEEREGAVVTASISEMTRGAGVAAMGGGYGDAGYAEGYAEEAYPSAMPPAPSMAMESGGVLEGRAERRSAESPAARDDEAAFASAVMDGRFAAMAAVIREDFPATLHFVGEVALDAAGRATVEVPLADAITTYRIEAIGWSGSGWISSGRTAVRVEQEAEIDAPVPEVAIVGDVLRLPVRVLNRGTTMLAARFDVTGEGGLAVTLGEPTPLEVPPGEARDAVLEVRPTAAGAGALVVTCRRTEGGAALDAVRRPLTVVEDARLVRDGTELLVEGRAAVTLELPAEAEGRGPAELRLRIAGAIFGAPVEWGAGDPPWAGWAIALAGQRIPPELATQLAVWSRMTGYGDPRDYFGRSNLQMALVLGALFDDEMLTDDEARAILRFLSDQLGVGPRSELYASYYGAYAPPISSEEASWVLLGLAPALRSAGRPALRADLEAVAEVLRAAASAEGALPVDQPETFARVAAALALTGAAPADAARADEMLRRTERSVIRVGELAWLEPDGDDGSIEPRIHPSALLALAYIGRGRHADALPILRAMADVARGAGSWSTRARALACGAASLITTGSGLAGTTLEVDGRPVELGAGPAGSLVASSDVLARPGAHAVTVTLAEGAIAVLEVQSRYAVPWSTPPASAARLALEWSGEAGARETRSALSLRIRNRGTRVVVRPVVEIQMPAGTELDEPTREGLASLLAEPPAMEGNVLRLALRPLAPGASIRLPIRSRWSVGGTLRGLGVSAFDDAESRRGAQRSYAVLPSRELTLPDEGPEPAVEDAVVPGAPTPVPPPVVPLPRRLVESVR
jgi:hypothetical protein